MSALTLPASCACCLRAVIFLGTLLRRMPERHLNERAKDAVRLGVGLIATIAALVPLMSASLPRNDIRSPSTSPLDVACAVLTWIKELLINDDTNGFRPKTGRARVDSRHLRMPR